MKKLKDPMKNLRNWKKGDPCTSNWTGIICNVTQNDGNLHIIELHLLNMNLTGSLSPELGKLSYLKIMDFMWNEISGSIPKEIGNIKSLELLLLNGNQLRGSLPEELGFLPNLDRLQIDENDISGPLPESFANLIKLRHLHLNNNSISGQIPSELSTLPSLIHFLLDNNNLSGYLPPELSEMPRLQILQLNNNHFDGTIPASYGNIPSLLKLSLRNCSLQGAIPDLSRIPGLAYIDLSLNQLNGSIPSNKLSVNITTIDLAYNNLTGPIPVNLSGLPLLQRLSLENNSLSGVVPSTIWQNRTFNGTETLLLDFKNNGLSNIAGTLNPPANVSIWLHGNPVCDAANQLNIVQFCGSQNGIDDVPEHSARTPAQCFSLSCPEFYEYVENSPQPCFCAVPLKVGYRLKSPGFSDFHYYSNQFKTFMTIILGLDTYQFSIASFTWEEGPRLRMYMNLFPEFNNQSNTFNDSEIRRIRSMFTEWKIPGSRIFGPPELLNFTLLGPYENVVLDFPKSGISKGALTGIVLGSVAVAIILSVIVMRRLVDKHQSSIKIDGVKSFTFAKMAAATHDFSITTQIGEGGYGKVYKGVLADETIVAVKRHAHRGSSWRENEFLTEIKFLSRVHHRNLVSLIGYCDEKAEQMLVYEFMPNGTLRDHLSGKEAPSFAMRLKIALGSAKGILYLHTEADPPIFHRDIKASNILLDSKFTAKVADFGLSKLAPVPDMEGTTPGHTSTVVKGTPGYVDPVYERTAIMTDKSDVYSLGVVFLELLTGKQPITRGKHISTEVNLVYDSGMISSIIDGQMGSYPSECVEKFVTLALNCCQDDRDARPSMAGVVRALENIWFMMPESESETLDSVDTSSEHEVTKYYTPLSISATRNMHISSDVSGSDHSSEVTPILVPR